MAMKRYSGAAHWRDSARPARFFVIDARAVFPFLLFLLHIQWWTFWLALVCIIFFMAIEHYGFTVPVFFRWLRTVLAGPRRLSKPWWRE